MVRPAPAAESEVKDPLKSVLLAMFEMQRAIKPHHLSLFVATEFEGVPRFRFRCVESRNSFGSRRSTESGAFRPDDPPGEIMEALQRTVEKFVAPAVVSPAAQSPKTTRPR